MRYRIIKTWNGQFEIQVKSFLSWKRNRLLYLTLEDAKAHLDSLQRMHDQRDNPEVILEREIPSEKEWY